MKKIKVMHLLQSNEFSGAENMVCEIMDMFENEDEYEMVYCSPNGHIKKILEKRNIKYYPIEKMSIYEIGKAIKQIHPDIVHAHDATACVLASFYRSKVRIVAHIHGNHINMRHFGLKALLVCICSFMWEKIIWVSRSSLEDYYYKDKVINKSIILSNIISKRSISIKINEDKEIYNYDGIFLGRINSIKNPMRALNIMKEVCKVRLSTRFAFVGDGDLLESCHCYVNANNLSDNIVFLGYKDNPIKILSCSKLLLMTSVYEGTPMCAIEAMGTGVPIVSTPTDGIVELIKQGETGYYSGDDSELVKGILSILNDDNLHTYMSNKSLNRFNELMDVKIYKEKLKKIYET